MQEPNFTSDRPTFHVVTRRPSQTRTTAPNESAPAVVRPHWTRWWKRLERASLILGLTGLSATSLIAGIGKYLDKMQAVATLEASVKQLEARIAHLEESNKRLENELHFIKGKLESRLTTAPLVDEEKRARNEVVSLAQSVTLPEAFARRNEPTRSAATMSLDPRAPMHVIDKLSMTINYAYRKARSANPNLAGRLLVKCLVDENGDLAASEVLALDAELEDVATNVRDKVKRWNFPETVTGLEEGQYLKTYFLTPSGF